MKPAWDRLMGDFEGHASALVGDADCTADGQSLCSDVGVKGYPTIKWGDPAALEDYQGGRTYDDLKAFADENLKASCSPANIDLCDDDKKAEIVKLQALSAEEIDAAITEKETALATAEKTFEEEVEKLQKTYKGLMEEKDAALKAVKESGLGLMKAVKAAAAAAPAKDEL